MGEVDGDYYHAVRATGQAKGKSAAVCITKQLMHVTFI